MDETTHVDPQGDLEVVKKMEDEHLRLQRQFRGIQTDRANRIMGVHPLFRSQDHLLKTLKKEYINLNKDLKIARSGRHKKTDKKMKNDLQRSLLDMMSAENECEGGDCIMEELDGLLHINTKEMLRLRKVAIAYRGELDARRFQSENRLMSAENKLETAMRRFNTIQAENRKIREEIDHILKDRALFNQAWDKMLSALGTGKKFLSDLFESSTLAYDQRDEWCYKLRSIQEKGKMDQMLQVQEMRELKKSFDHEMKIYNFLAKKGVKRVNEKQEKRETLQKIAAQEESKKKLNLHLQILEEINKYTQESSCNNIIDEFVRKEFENFSTYSLLTDYCAENEVLRRDVNNIQRDIADRVDFNEMNASRREINLENLRHKLEEQKIRTDKVRVKSEDQCQLLNRTMEKIQDIFQMLGCSLEPFQNLLGDKQPTLNTSKLTLLLITEKIKEYGETVYYCERVLKMKDTSDKFTSRLKKFTVRAELPIIFTPLPLNLLVPADPCPSCIETRWLSRVSEAAESPLDQKQVLDALQSLAEDPAYLRSDRVHALADCRATASRRLLATRHAQY